MVTTQLLYHYDNDYLDGYHLMVYTTFFRTLATFPGKSRELVGQIPLHLLYRTPGLANGRH